MENIIYLSARVNNERKIKRRIQFFLYNSIKEERGKRQLFRKGY